MEKTYEVRLIVKMNEPVDLSPQDGQAFAHKCVVDAVVNNKANPERSDAGILRAGTIFSLGNLMSE